MDDGMIRNAAMCLAAVLVGGSPLVAQPLERGFVDPPATSRPSAFWCWLNGSMTRAQVTRDLEEVKAKGMGGLEIWDVAAHDDELGEVPAGPAFLSDESLELIAHAIREGTRLDLNLGMVASSGWNAGGSWVPPQHAGKGLFWSETAVRGGAEVMVKPAFPECPLAPKRPDGMPVHFKEIAVLAVPAGGELAGVDQVIDLGDMMAADGTLHWQAPAGDWVVLRFVCSNHGQQLIVPSPNSHGPMIDFIDPAATEFHIRHIAEGILAKLGRKDFRGTSFKYLEFDSMELADGVLWSDDFAGRFEELRGYSPLPYLPLFADWSLQDAREAQRFEHDYRQSISDQLIHSHYVTGSKVLAEYGLHLVAEAGGPGPPIWESCPVDAIQALGAVDVPRGEFWMGNPKHIFLIKEIASAAHVHGRRLVDAESFTTWRRWLDGPVAHKRLADRALCEGLNHFTLHTMASSPPEAGLPGRAYHAGTDINPTATWWNQSKPFFDYLARCAHMLRQGHFVADVCYFYGAQAPNFYPAHMNVPRKIVPDELGLGYDYDVCDAQTLLTRARAQRGRLVLADGMSYEILALREQETMPLEVLRKIRELAENGVTVVGPPPRSMAGLNRSAEEQAEFAQLVSQMWGAAGIGPFGRGGVVHGVSWRSVLQGYGIVPDFLVDDEHQRDDLDYIHRRDGGRDIYFVRNRTMQPQSLDCLFRAAGGLVSLWDPLTGEIGSRFSAPLVNGARKVRMDLAPAGSVFVVFDTPVNGEPLLAEPPPVPRCAGTSVAGPWSLSFPDGWGVAPGARTLDKLTCWTASDEVAVKYFSGTATYRTAIDVPAGMATTGVVIDLGDVRDVAEVFLNGRRLGIVWTPPYQLAAGDTLKPGTNELEVRVTNLWANRLLGDKLHPELGRFTRTNLSENRRTGDKPLPSGLLGPVMLRAGN